ncbi:hypothetical protein CCR90_00325 [Rhodovulum sulfidophilum]|uniref:DUF2125 domain-containing protein n=1 Tax=Rhodovulum sulfidophilum TaxID=35806 RepID=UPI0019146B0F|nr:DUF2125 domain-containing protein [Rhodovulum sulfidophilum]MBK5922241.1 hypothetical protein [Rhodovulum sulfidophilum]
MTLLKSASALAIATSFGLALPAAADVTADEVWSSWQALAQGSGQSMSGTESRSGDRLTVKDLLITSTDEQGGSVQVGFDSIVFAERGDGSVAIEVPETYPMSVEIRNAKGEVTELDFTVTQPDFEMIASGTPEALVQDFNSPEVTLTLDRVSGDGPADVEASMKIDGMSGHYAQTEAEPRVFESDLAIDRVHLELTAEGRNEDTDVKLVGTVHDVSSTSDSRMPVGIDPTELAEMMRAGLMSQGELEHGAMAYAFDLIEDGNKTHAEVSVNSGRIAFDLGGTGVSYDASGKETRMALYDPQLPVPEIEAKMAESGIHFEMPLIKADEPSDFGLGIRLKDLTVNDEVWATFDPTEQLPRDPATLLVDLAGKTRLLTDFTDADVTESDGIPAELDALNVKDMQLKLAGADLTGSGAFTFDNSDKVTFDGMPLPEGSLSLRLEGANALLDKLVAMGLVPEDQVMGLRMMMGMFARPGDGPDTMVSEITVSDGGQVRADGQRLR